MSSLTNHLYRFGEFTVDVQQRVLLREGKPVPLTPKVFDTLLILVESHGRIVEKEELKKRLWPDTFVEEANIAFNIQQLRKTLNDDARNPRYIGTVARRGYRFIAEVESLADNGGQPDERGGSESSQSPWTLASNNVAQLATTSAGSALGDVSEASNNSRTKLIVFGVAAVLLLSGAGIGVWKLSRRSTDDSAKPKLSTGNSPSTTHLKLEQLTVTGQSYHLAISPDGKYVAYERVFENRRGGIWLRQLATNTNVEIVPPTGQIYGVAFDSKGEYLYFVKGDPLSLFRVSLLGGAPTKIIDNLEGNFSLSTTDNRIALVRQTINSQSQRQYSLIIANSDGTGERTLLTEVYPHGLDTPLWAPDGRTIICSYGNTTGGSQDVQLIEVNVADAAKRDLSPKIFFRVTKMAWLADGKNLILSARRNLGENNQLWRLSYPAMELTQITQGLTSYADLSVTPNGERAVASQETLSSDVWIGSSREPTSLKKMTQAAGSFSWAPDGRLVYSSTASGNRDLWIMRADGTEQKQLTVDPALDINPRVTPDNRFVVFVSNRTGAFQLWRMNIDGSNQVQLTRGAPKSYHSISADSKWVFYNSTDDWHLWRVSIDGGEPFEVAAYVAAWPSISPDQKLIVCAGRKGASRELLILPFEGGPPIKRLELPAGQLAGYRIKWTADGKAFIYMFEEDGPIAIVKQSVEGGRPEVVATFDQDELFDFDYSTDGQMLAVTRGAWEHDVVLITDLNQ